MDDLTEPVDLIHEMCMRAIRQIRQATVDAKMRVAVWEPRPMPENYAIRLGRGAARRPGR